MAENGAKNDLNALMARVRLRDRKAYTELYRLTSAKLFGILMRMLKNRAEAEDALQEVFIKVWQRAERFSASEGKPETWLAAIARNHAIDMMRARRPEASVIDEAFDLASDTPDPEAETIARSEGGRIDRCLRTLENDRAEAVKQAYIEGLSYQELADFYNIPLNTMRTWLRRSLLKLRECLGQ
jgi:RNA polymerase sigma-70 factor (ECF subfamily)